MTCLVILLKDRLHVYVLKSDVKSENIVSASAHKTLKLLWVRDFFFFFSSCTYYLVQVFANRHLNATLNGKINLEFQSKRNS